MEGGGKGGTLIEIVESVMRDVGVGDFWHEEADQGHLRFCYFL